MRRRQFAVIGLGNFGFSVARTLSEKQCQVLCVDEDMEKVEAVKDFVTNAVQADVTDEKALRAVGMSEIDVAVISLGQNQEASILASLILQDLGVKEIVAKVVSEIHARVLRKLGVAKVVFPEKDMGKRVAEQLVTPQILVHLELSKEHGIEEIVAPDEFCDKSIADLQVRSRYGLSILAIRRQTADGKEELVVNPTPEARIRCGDIVIVIGREEDLEKLR